MTNDRKARGWGFVLYPENNEDLELVIEQLHIPVVLSPLHDSDVWNEMDEAKDETHIAGRLKPPHWHGMFLYDGPVRCYGPLRLLEQFSNPTHYVEPISSITSYARYMLHLDNPEKAQYNRADMGFYNGAVVSIERQLTPEELEIQTDEIIDFCRENNVTEYADLVFYARDNRPDWSKNVRRNTVMWRGLFASWNGVRSAKQLQK